MKRLILAIFCTVQLLPIYAQKMSSFEILSDKSYQTIIDIQVGDVQQQKVQTPQGEAVKILVDKGTQWLKAGAPDVPKLSFSIIIPNQKNSTISVLESEYTDIQNIAVAPSKGKMYRNQLPSNIPFTYGEEYTKNDRKHYSHPAF